MLLRVFSMNRGLVRRASTAIDTVDVAIVGAGVVGATLACSIARTPNLRNLRVAVIEPRAPMPLQTCAQQAVPDARVFTITPASQAVLAAAGAWPAIVQTRAPAFTSMRVWDALGPASLSFDAADAGLDQLGWVVENRVLEAALWAELAVAAETSAGRVRVFCPGALAGLRLPTAAGAWRGPAPAASAAGDPALGGGLAEVRLADGRSLRARLVVGADGAQSRVRELAAIGTWGWDYDQRGVVATVRTNEDRGGPGAPLRRHATAWQRFLPDGPVAVLPLWDDLSSVVWSTTPAHAAELATLSGPEFVARLNAALSEPSSAFVGAMRSRIGGPMTTRREEESEQQQHPGGSGSGSSPASAADAAHRLYDRSTDTLTLDPLALAVRAGHAVAGLVTDVLARGARAGAQQPLVLEAVGQRASFPLRLAKANTDARHRLALIGDAAHSMHPLAGQGLNLGIADASALAAALSDGAAAGADPGSLGVLGSFGRRRYAEGTATVLAMDAIKRAFSLPAGADPAHAVWVPLRNVGMALIDRSAAGAPLKALLAHVATGAWRN